LGAISQYADGSCPSVTGVGGYYAGWVTYANSCAPACNAPAPTSSQQTRTITVNGPACRFGGTDTFLQNQVSTQTTTYFCPAPTGPYTANVGAWGPWVNSGGLYGEQNNCVTCVSVNAFVYIRRGGIEQCVHARDVRVGDELRIMNPKTGAKRWGQVSHSETTQFDGVQIATESGITLTCSTSAPIGLADGGSAQPAHLEGRLVAVDDHGTFRVEAVTSVKSVGIIDVQHITCEDDFFLAGDVEGRSLAHHNKKLGFCVSVNAFVMVRRAGIEQIVRAGEVRATDEVRLMDPATGVKDWGRVFATKVTSVPRVRVRTASGFTLTCSKTAPIGLATGESVISVNLKGHLIGLDVNGVYRIEQVVDVEDVGDGEVQNLSCEGEFYLVGDAADAFLAHHS
jgi:hypothetical protein